MKREFVFDFNDYREFLSTRLPVRGEGRGGRSALAKHLGCELSFVSLVLTRRAHFSLEHAHGVAEFLKLEPNELEFFLLLVSKNRAGSKKLEAYFQKKVDTQLRERLMIRNRIQPDRAMGLEHQVEYYSHWAYTAVHMCLLNPKLGSAEAISTYLKIPIFQTRKILDFFLSNGLAEREGNRVRSGPVRIHIPSDSPLVSRHHTNWRLRSLETISSPKADDLHYSLVMSVSKSAAEQIRSILLHAIEQSEPVLKSSEDEAVYSLSVDLFEVGQRYT